MDPDAEKFAEAREWLAKGWRTDRWEPPAQMVIKNAAGEERLVDFWVGQYMADIKMGREPGETPTGDRSVIILGEAPANETGHFYVCEVCGQAVDKREFVQVMHHAQAAHGPLPRHS